MSDLKVFGPSYSSESCPWPGCSRPAVDGEQVAVDHLAQQSVHILDHNEPSMTQRCNIAFQSEFHGICALILLNGNLVSGDYAKRRLWTMRP